MSSLIISFVAITISAITLYYSRKFSQIGILNNLQDLMLRKADDCNKLWDKACVDVVHPNASSEVFSNSVLEVYTSLNLLDNCLENYSLKDKREFLIKQFWAQLTYRFRVFLKDDTSQDKVKSFSGAIIDFQRDFHYLKPVLH